jgi:hypothetical protein
VKMLFLVGYSEWPIGPSAGCDCRSPHKRQKSDGALCQFNGNENTGMGMRHRHERSSGRAVGYSPLGLALLVLGLIRVNRRRR